MTNTTSTTDPRPSLAAAFDSVANVISQVRSEHLALVTPCAEMTVDELLSHLVMAGERISCAGRSIPLMEWPSNGPALELNEWAGRWKQIAEETTTAWTDDALLDRQMTLPWGAFVGSSVVAVYTSEFLVHGWDLATTIGATVEWDPTAIEVAMEEMHRQLPEPDRSPMWSAMAEMMPPGVPWEDPFANATEVAADAAPIERLVAWCGRDVTGTSA